MVIPNVLLQISYLGHLVLFSQFYTMVNDLFERLLNIINPR